MGHTIWVDIRGRSEEDTPQDNSIMVRLDSLLEQLCEKLGVTKFSEFYDYSELEDMYGDLDENGDEAEESNSTDKNDAASGVWFDPGIALIALRTVHDRLAQSPEELGFDAKPSQSHWFGDLMKELSHSRNVLEKAIAQERQFRFLLVP